MPAYKNRPRGNQPPQPLLPCIHQSGARAAAPNPTSLAPGARLTVVKHTPSNKHILVYIRRESEIQRVYIYIYIKIYLFIYIHNYIYIPITPSKVG